MLGWWQKCISGWCHDMYCSGKGSEGEKPSYAANSCQGSLNEIIESVRSEKTCKLKPSFDQMHDPVDTGILFSVGMSKVRVLIHSNTSKCRCDRLLKVACCWSQRCLPRASKIWPPLTWWLQYEFRIGNLAVGTPVSAALTVTFQKCSHGCQFYHSRIFNLLCTCNKADHSWIPRGMLHVHVEHSLIINWSPFYL